MITKKCTLYSGNTHTPSSNKNSFKNGSLSFPFFWIKFKHHTHTCLEAGGSIVISSLSSQSYFNCVRDTKFILCPEFPACTLLFPLVYFREGLWCPPSSLGINVFVSFDHFATVFAVCLLSGLEKHIVRTLSQAKGDNFCLIFFSFCGLHNILHTTEIKEAEFLFALFFY